MEINRLAQMRPRTVWDIVDDAFDLYRARFTLLFGIAILAFGPAILAGLLLLSPSLGQLIRAAQPGVSSGQGEDAAAGAFFAGLLLAAPLFVAAQGIHQGATAAAVAAAVTQQTDLSLRSAFGAVWRRAPLLIGSALVGSLAVLACSLVAGILAWYPMTILAFTGEAIVLEGRGFGAALRRSQNLASPNFWRALGLILVTRLLHFLLAVGALVGAVEGFGLVFGLLPGGNSGHYEAQRGILFLILLALAFLLVVPLDGVARTLLYYDVRVRREGLDLVARAIEEGYPLAPDPFGDISSEQVLRRSRRQGR